MQLDHQQACIDERSPALGDELEDHLQIGLRPHGPRDLSGGVERSHRPFELVAVLACAGVAARVVDCESSQLGEHREGLLVGLGELLPALLLGEVKVPVRDPIDHDRHPEEAPHRRVAVGEAVGALMPTDVGEPQRPRVGDQLAQHPAPSRERPDRLALHLVDPNRDEAIELGVRGAQHPQCGIARASKLARGLQHPVEHHLDVQRGEHTARDVQYTACGLIHQRASVEWTRRNLGARVDCGAALHLKRPTTACLSDALQLFSNCTNSNPRPP